MVKAAMLPERYMALLQAEADAKPEPQKAEEVQPKEPEPKEPEPQKIEPTKAVTETAK